MKDLLSFCITFIDMTTTKNSTPNRRLKHPIAVVALHWLCALAITICFITGQRISADHLNLFDTPISNHVAWTNWLPQGAMFEWHRISAWILSFSLIAYLLFIFLSGRFQHLRVNKNETAKKKFNKNVIWIGLAAVSLQVISGALINSPIAGGVAWINGKILHSVNAWLIMGYVCLHIIAIGISKGNRHLLSLFRFNFKQLRVANIALAFSLALTFVWLSAPDRTLDVAFSKAPPLIDGIANDPIWVQTDDIRVTTRYGHTLESKLRSEHHNIVPIDVKATHDNERLYLLLRWPDKEPSQNHLPLLKTKAGWIVESDGFMVDNELQFYEDKLAIMLSNDSKLDAVRSIHLGEKPLSNAPPARHGRGYHYTTSGQILDIWQWKSVRSNPLRQADDSHFGPAKTPLACSPRYTAGYGKDPSVSGGYVTNYDYFKDSYTDTVTPLRLSGIALGHQNSSASKAPAWARWSDGQNYNQMLDQRIPDDSRLPGIINSGPMEGDRGDVGAKGRWENGYWTLEISRTLASSSPYDTSIQTGTFMWFAAFNHAQTRHSYHLWPITLNLSK